MATQRIGNNRIADGEVTGPKLGLNSINANNLSSSVNTYITNLISGGDPTANAAFVTANAAFITANAAFAQGNAAAGVDTTQNNSITVALNTANAAFALGNSTAGVDTTQNNSITAAYNQANAAYTSANAINGVDVTQNNSITAAFNTANAAFTSANSINGVDLSQNNRIAYSETTSNAAFTRANNSLNANTGGVIGGPVTVSQNLTVVGDTSISGNLYVSGNTVSISAGSLVANDSLIILGIGNYVSDIVDLGFSAHYNNGTNAHSGLIRDSGTKEWHLFKGYTPEMGGTNNVDINDASFVTDTLNANVKAPGLVTVKGIDLLNYANIIFNTANASFTAANVQLAVDITQNNNTAAAFIAANSAFFQANAAFITANNAAGTDLTQNTNITIANNTAVSAFYQANAAFISANNAAGVDLTQNTNITTANNTAVAAFIQANGVFGQSNNYVWPTANAAFVRANNALDANNGGAITGPVAVRSNLNIQSVTETANIYSTAIGGNVILAVANNSSYYFSAGQQTANITFDLRANNQAGGSLNAYMTTGQMISVGIMINQGPTAYRANLYIDGVLQTANTRWSGNVNPANGGTINGIDVYSFSVLKTAANAYIILASNTAFANGATSVY